MHRKPYRVIRAALAASAVAIVHANTAIAAGGGDWINASNSDNLWSTGANWSTGVAPSATDAVSFNSNATYDVAFNADATAGAFTVGGDDVTLALGGHVLTVAGALTAGAGAALDVSGGTVAQTAGNLLIADQSAGRLAIEADGQLTTAGTFRAGNSAGNFGTVLDLTNGGTLTTGTAGLATNASATGVTASVGGPGSAWTVNGDLGIGGYGATYGTPVGGAATLAINPGGAVTVTGTAKVWNATSALNLAGGTLTAGSLDVAGAQAAWFHWTAGTLQIDNSNLSILSYNSSSLSVDNPAKSLRVTTRPGGSTSATGTVTVYSGATWNVTAGSVYAHTLDLSQADRVSITGGAITVDGGQFLFGGANIPIDDGTGHPNSYSNAYAISGAAGSNAGPQITLQNGAMMYSHSYLLVGNTGGKGSLTLTGAKTYLNNPYGGMGYIQVGDYRTIAGGVSVPADGTLAIKDGATVYSWDTIVGYDGGKGSMTIDGANSKLINTTGGLTVGGYRYLNFADFSTTYAGDGNCTVTNGGAASTYFDINVGLTGGHGVLTADGANTTLTASRGLSIGNGRYNYAGFNVPGDGTLTLTNGAQANGSKGAVIGYGGARGVINVGKSDGTDAGGTQLSAPSLTLGQSSSNAADAGATLNVYPGGTVLVSGSLTTYANTANPAAVRVNLAGGTLSANAVTLADPAHLNWTAGRLTLTGGASAVGALAVPTAGTLTGTGAITGTVTNAGTIAPGSSPAAGTLALTGDLANAGTLDLQIAGASTFDRLALSGTFSAGGVIEVDLVGGYAPSAGNTFDLMDFSSLSPNGYSFDLTHAPLAPGLAWDTSAFATTGTIGVISASTPEPTGLALAGVAAAGLLSRKRRRA